MSETDFRYYCANAADQGEAMSLMPLRLPSPLDMIALGQAKLMGMTLRSTTSTRPSDLNASMISVASRTSAETYPGSETSTRG